MLMRVLHETYFSVFLIKKLGCTLYNNVGYTWLDTVIAFPTKQRKSVENFVTLFLLFLKLWSKTQVRIEVWHGVLWNEQMVCESGWFLIYTLFVLLDYQGVQVILLQWKTVDLLTIYMEQKLNSIHFDYYKHIKL